LGEGFVDSGAVVEVGMGGADEEEGGAEAGFDVLEKEEGGRRGLGGRRGSGEEREC
jgi:hypothetical protein